MNILVCGDNTFVENMQRTLSEEGHRVIAVATSIPQAASFLKNGGYDAVIIGFDVDDARVLLEDFRPPEGVRVLVSVTAVSPAMWSRIAAVGGIPVVRGQELGFLRNGKIRPMEQRAESVEIQELRRKDVQARIERVEAETAKVGILKQRIIAVYSPKGGAGKTTVATSLGQTLARLAGLKVCVVDLDHTREGSDLARKYGYYMISGRVPRAVITAWANFPEREYASWEKVMEYLNETPVPNLYFLPSAWNVEDERFLTDKLVEKVAHVLQRHMDIIIFDLPDDLRPSNTTAMGLSDLILLVSGVDLDSIDIASAFVQRTAGKLQLPLEKLRLVFNHVPEKLPYTLEEGAQKIGLPLYAHLPEDPEVRKPRRDRVIDGTDKTPFGQGMYRLTQNLLPPGALTAKKAHLPWYKRLFAFAGRMA